MRANFPKSNSEIIPSLLRTSTKLQSINNLKPLSINNRRKQNRRHSDCRETANNGWQQIIISVASRSLIYRWRVDFSVPRVIYALVEHVQL